MVYPSSGTFRWMVPVGPTNNIAAVLWVVLSMVLVTTSQESLVAFPAPAPALPSGETSATAVSPLPYCSQHNSHVNGSWVAKSLPEAPDARLSKSFHCCGWDDNDYRHSVGTCGPNSPDRAMYHGSNQFVTQCGGHCCSCDEGNRDLPTKVEQYTWTPQSCLLLPWNATQFCDLLSNRTVLIVGDSTAGQAASTLMSMIKSGGGTCGERISFGNADYAIWGRGWGLEKYIDFAQPDILILNAGAHCKDPGDVYSVLEKLRPIMQEVRRKYAASNRNLTLAWKTNHAGHYACPDYTAPLDHWLVGTDPALDRYHWNMFPQFDQIAKDYSLPEYLNYKIIDMSPLYMRPDAHARHSPVDCLHYCMPGPIDLFSILLQQMLYNNEL
jgi:hypothetical protein